MSNAYDMAFPVLDRSQTPNDSTQLGLTKREYFAAMALQGLCANSSVDLDPSCGECAVELADNLIRALNKPVQP